nr:retrovirus-related Pol polyprotein from transposon TNT 1-94 [Tanacetum cinerariifolium]
MEDENRTVLLMTGYSLWKVILNGDSPTPTRVVDGVVQMCDKKNSVLFTDTECVVLSFDFKLPDKNHVLLRVPKENNMYNVDLKNVVPSGDFTCLFVKATLDESNLWHRRLGHINFKTMNKLVKGNLVRGLPSKNKVAERKNRTLIEAARTMLADSLLPIPFWAEAVNTACYVQNRVLVTKPHNKTPYELLLGRTPSIGFMRPFRCPVTILNTLDPLGKFDGKADEGFLAGYSVYSKAFRVFNSRTKIVQEILHINFLENQPNVLGSGPKWLFDIDDLTQSMNYQPVVAGNQPNPSAGIQGTFNADTDVTFDVKENESEVHVSLSSSDKLKKHDDKTKREAKRKSHVDLSTRIRDLRDEFEEFFVNSTNRVNVVSAPVTAVEPNLTNSTNSFNADSPSDNVVSLTFEIGGKYLFMDPSQYLDDSDMPALEDIVYSDDEEDVGVKADFSNLETSITISPILTTRIQKDHPVTQIIEVYVFQPPRFEDLDYPDKVYKVVKALYGLHQALRAWYETLANYLLENGFQRGKIDQSLFIKKQKDGKSASVPINTEKPLLKDPDGEDVDVHIYSDYAGESLDKKSTTGGCQFLSCRLISWQCKNQTIVATSSTKAKYVAVASCCAQDLVSVKKSNDVVKLQALIDRKKVVITEDTIRHDLRLDDADGVECLPNEEIFTELACMGYEKPPPKLTFYKEFFSAQWNMVRNVDIPSKFIMYPRFLQVMINAQVDDLSSHNTKYTSPSLTQKVFANMRRIAKVEEDEDDEVYAAPTPPLPTPATTPPLPQQEVIPSPPQTQPAPLSLPPQQQPTQTLESLMALLKTLMKTCATLAQKVANLEQDKIAQALEITVEN